MVTTTTARARFRYTPPFAWEGPRPVVEAFQAQEVTTFVSGDTRLDLIPGEWLLESKDGGLETMPDRTFRSWYRPVDDEADAALRGERVRPRRRPHRRTRSASRAAQAQLKL